jgi:hypothetical protein
MQRDLASAAKIANNTAMSCEKLLYYVHTVVNNDTKTGMLFSLSDEIVEKLLFTEEDTASGPPIVLGLQEQQQLANRSEYLTSW